MKTRFPPTLIHRRLRVAAITALPLKIIWVIAPTIIALLPSLASAQQSPNQQGQSGVYTWYDGDVRHEIHLRRDLVAEVGQATGSPANASASGVQKLSGQVMKRDGRIRIVKVSGDSLQKATTGELAINQSPVFSDAAAGGPLRTLPGGLIVTFKQQKTESEVRAWASEHGLAFDRLLPVTTETMAAFKTNPGLESLEAANQVRSLPDVKAAQPNWWIEKWKGSSQKPLASQKAIEQAKSGRCAASKRMNDSNLGKSPQ